MKQIIRLAPSKFIHLDSYGESYEKRREFFIVAGISLIIATLTVGALLGTDVTQFNTQTNQVQLNKWQKLFLAASRLTPN